MDCWLVAAAGGGGGGGGVGAQEASQGERSAGPAARGRGGKQACQALGA